MGSDAAFGLKGDSARLDATGGREAAVDARSPSDATREDGGGLYNPCPTNGTPCTILPMGDSITVGIGTGAKGGGYRVELFKKAVADGKTINFEGISTEAGPTPSPPFPNGFANKHSARSGWTIEQISGMVADSLARKPDIILLMAGTNDSYGTDPAGAPTRLGTLLDKIFAADAHVLVVLAKLTPCSLSQSAINSINAAISGLASSRIAAGKHLVVVDMNTGFPSATLEDSVHPNQTGYAWMSDVWYRAVGGLLR